jgi:hypothetical protein
MCDAIGAVAMTQYKSMTKRQLPAYRIDAQIHPWTFADFRVRIVSNLGAETADRDEVIHDTLPQALAARLDTYPRTRDLKTVIVRTD